MKTVNVPRRHPFIRLDIQNTIFVSMEPTTTMKISFTQEKTFCIIFARVLLAVSYENLSSHILITILMNSSLVLAGLSKIIQLLSSRMVFHSHEDDEMRNEPSHYYVEKIKFAFILVKPHKAFLAPVMRTACGKARKTA